MKKKIVFLNKVHPSLFQGLKEAGYFCIDLSEHSEEKIIVELKTCFGVILRSRLVFNRKILEKCKNLSFIGRVGSGLENIDVDFCKAKGINVFNSPEGNRTAVAEQALGMLLNLFNNLQNSRDQIKKNLWLREENTGIELSGKTIAIIGYGNNGSEFVKLLKGFNVRILVYDKYKKLNKTSQYTPTSMSSIFKYSDIVSIHTPLTKETEGMVDKEFITKFEKKIYLINVSRGKIVNTKDLVLLLKKGKVLGACLDVVETENNQFKAELKNNKDIQYMIKNNNVVLTPHTAGLTQESYRKLSEVILSKIQSKY